MGFIFGNIKDINPEVLFKSSGKSLPLKLGPVESSSSQFDLLKAISIVVALNRERLKCSNGMIVKCSIGKVAYPGLQTALQKVNRMALRNKGSTNWFAYISPEEKFYYIENERCLGSELKDEKTKLIQDMINSIG